VTFSSNALDWLLCRPELQEARKAAERTPHEATMMERAASALAAASLIAEVPNSSGQFSARHASILALESLYWVLLSYKPDLVDAEPSALWEASTEPIRKLDLTADETKELERVLAMKRPMVDLAGLSDEEQVQVSKTLLRVAEVALSVAERQKHAVETISAKRFARTGLVLCAAMVLVVGAVTLKPERKIVDPGNLAIGKPWTVSSKMFDCDPKAGTCGGAQTKILFHTNEEDSPWIQYDLGEPMAFKGVTVKNRQDGLQERAVPLILEISDDGKSYKEIARRDESFSEWAPAIPPQRARFVRVRAVKRTYLHLEAVKINP
jgi:hypothetical protein